jgi:hypothetical protein
LLTGAQIEFAILALSQAGVTALSVSVHVIHSATVAFSSNQTADSLGGKSVTNCNFKFAQVKTLVKKLAALSIIHTLSALTIVIFAVKVFKSTRTLLTETQSHELVSRFKLISQVTICTQLEAVDTPQLAISKSVTQSLEKYHLESQASYLT